MISIAFYQKCHLYVAAYKNCVHIATFVNLVCNLCMSYKSYDFAKELFILIAFIVDLRC